MKYDFESIMDRRGRDALAVDELGKDWPPGLPKEGFDVIPMWVADMNFPTVPTVQEAIIERAKHPAFGYFSASDEYYNSIIKAIKNGRNIYENIKNCTKYLLASNIGEVLTILLVILFSLILDVNLGIPLASIQLLWINVITDSLPAFGLGLQQQTDEIMKRPPRKNDEPFFANGVGEEIIFFGICIGLLTIITYLIGLKINPIFL